MFIGLSINVFAQPKTLTRHQFFSPIHSAQDMRFITSRREKMILKVYEANKIQYSSTQIYEYLLPDKLHYISTEESNGKTAHEEIIKIGNSVYQKTNKGSWVRNDDADYFGGGCLNASSNQ